MAVRGDGKGEALPGSLLLVIHDFVARSADELSLAKGDRIELIERDDDFGDGWFLGRHLSNGNTGLFPEVYTTPAPKGTLNSTPRRASEGPPKSAGTDGTSTSSPTMLRHSSATTPTVQRPASAASEQPAPLVSPGLRTSLSSVTSPNRAANFSADSPVMNETLSVINEHIKMNTPQSNLGATNKRDTMGSVYSTQPLNRFSYIPGHETDEDDHHFHTEDEVMAWSPGRVAEYLEDHGVEKLHCDVFREQEISGEVLLAMDQSSLFIKEFELGPVGRRLKTWHKIKALQDEVRHNAPPEVARSTNSDYSAVAGAVDENSESARRNRSSTIGTVLPQGLSTSSRRSMDTGPSKDSPALSAAQSAATNLSRGPSVVSPLQSMTSMSRPENTYRPSAQTIRTMNHARRHSSIDSTSSVGTRQSHRKQPSLDKKWQPGQPALSNGQVVVASNGQVVAAAVPAAASPSTLKATTPGTPSSPGELDRGYFSSNEADSRNGRNAKLGRKNTASVVSPIQSRANSFLHNGRQSAQSGGPTTSTSVRDPVSPLVGAGTASSPSLMSSMVNKFGSIRSVTTPDLQVKPMASIRDTSNPIVTKLDYSNNTPSSTAVASTPKTQADSESSSVNVPTPSPSSANLGFFGSQKQKITGLRAISDAVTNKEKTMTAIPVDSSPTPLKEDVSSPTRTGSTTPSTETRSIDMQKSTDGTSRASTGSAGRLMLPSTNSTRRPRPKTKKTTSAYTRGLEKKTPAEQISTCDYSGWMKKKSGSLMTTWKPRLFILKGRRLSYYYRDDDIEEKGLIDISFHRVLPAHNETLTGLHASITGAAGIPTSPTHTSSTPLTNAERDLKANPVVGEKPDNDLFIFKLVPPKSGLAKGVSFTKPTVHYFAVNSRQEGRLWMAALMKATIDRDDDGVVTTTYNQKTISLAKARARKERPPALQEDEAEGRAELDGDTASGRSIGGDAATGLENGKGLGIGNMGSSEKNDSAVGGSEREKDELLPQQDGIVADAAAAQAFVGPAVPASSTGSALDGGALAETPANKERPLVGQILDEKEVVGGAFS